MHPDQSTPDTHRYRAADSHPDKDRAARQSAEADSDEPGSAPDVEDGARVAEAGNAYVGRTMDDDLKSSPRVVEPGEGVDEDAD